MYLGHVQDFINQEKNMRYNDLLGKYEFGEEKEYIFENDAELVAKYLEILWYATNPLYPYQFKPMAQIMRKIEAKVSDDIIEDLKLLSDKDLIIKYNLPPHKISTRYYNIENIEDIRESNKTDLLYKKDLFWNNYKKNIEEWGEQYG